MGTGEKKRRRFSSLLETKSTNSISALRLADRLCFNSLVVGGGGGGEDGGGDVVEALDVMEAGRWRWVLL